MSFEATRRGRPKGTGIDDSATLEKIATMIARDPDLKPTTAIKKIGYSDPSTIRRLRDKFNQQRDDLLSAAGDENTKKPEREIETRAIALDKPRDPTIREDVSRDRKKKSSPEETRKSASKNRAEPEFSTSQAVTCRDVLADVTGNPWSGPPPVNPVSSLACDLIASGLRSANAFSSLQLALLTEFTRSPLFHTALRHQIAMSRLFIGCTGPQPAFDPVA